MIHKVLYLSVIGSRKNSKRIIKQRGLSAPLLTMLNLITLDFNKYGNYKYK